MVGHSRYNVSKKDASVYENGVLINNLDIHNQADLDDAETILLNDSYLYFLDNADNLKIDLNLLFDINKFFLGSLYKWAGNIRSVDISKDGFKFCHAKYIEDNLKKFIEILDNNLLDNEDDIKIISNKLAIIHNELNVIHPFRDGNGRTIRLFLDIVVYKSGFNTIDWNSLGLDFYIKACVQGVLGNHGLMEKIIFEGLNKRV